MGGTGLGRCLSMSPTRAVTSGPGGCCAVSAEPHPSGRPVSAGQTGQWSPSDGGLVYAPPPSVPGVGSGLPAVRRICALAAEPVLHSLLSCVTRTAMALGHGHRSPWAGEKHRSLDQPQTVGCPGLGGAPVEKRGGRAVQAAWSPRPGGTSTAPGASVLSPWRPQAPQSGGRWVKLRD